MNKKVEQDLAGDLGKQYDEASLRAWYFLEQIAKDKETEKLILDALMHFLTDTDTILGDAPYPIWAYPF